VQWPSLLITLYNYVYVRNMVLLIMTTIQMINSYSLACFTAQSVHHDQCYCVITFPDKNNCSSGMLIAYLLVSDSVADTVAMVNKLSVLTFNSRKGK